MTTSNVVAKNTPALKATVDGSTLTIEFSHGQVLTVTASDYSEAIQQQAMMHGLKQKLSDAAAISRDPATGRSATVEDKYQAVLAVAERLREGSWNLERTGGGGNTGLLLQALNAVYGERLSSEQIKGWLATLSTREQDSLKLTPAIAKAIKEIVASKTKGIDTKDLLSQLEAFQVAK